MDGAPNAGEETRMTGSETMPPFSRRGALALAAGLAVLAVVFISLSS